LEVQPAIQALLALKGGAGAAASSGGGGQLDVMDNVLSPFLLLAAAEKMSVSSVARVFGSWSDFQTTNPLQSNPNPSPLRHHLGTGSSGASSVVGSCQGPLPMYQDVSKDVATLLHLFGSYTSSHHSDEQERLRRVLVAVLAALKLRVLLCRWFLAQAQRPPHPRPEEQEVLLRLLSLQRELEQAAGIGDRGGGSPQALTLARLASSGGSPPVGTPSSPRTPLLASPRAAAAVAASGAAAGAAAAVLLDPREAVEALEEDVGALRARLGECAGEEEAGLRAWAETVALEAQAVLSGP
jgi:hypothetical protein